MCDFKPGDEVVCVAPGRHRLVEGAIYTVAAVRFNEIRQWAVIDLRELRNDGFGSGGGFAAHRFRKVQRRDLSAWLETSVGNTDKLDKRQTKKVRA